MALTYLKSEGIVEKGTILNPQTEDILQMPRFQVTMEIYPGKVATYPIV